MELEAISEVFQNAHELLLAADGGVSLQFDRIIEEAARPFIESFQFCDRIEEATTKLFTVELSSSPSSAGPSRVPAKVAMKKKLLVLVACLLRKRLLLFQAASLAACPPRRVVEGTQYLVLSSRVTNRSRSHPKHPSPPKCLH
jgi:hypothetical protein